MTQLSMFDILEPKPEPRPYVDDRRKFMSRAYGTGYELTLSADQDDPYEIEVRGCRTLIVARHGSMLAGFQTYTLGDPGSLYWSQTGFRSWTGVGEGAEDGEAVTRVIERYIDRPAKDGNGCGGKLVRWWPRYILDWQASRAFALSFNRATTWDQWGPEKQKECWENHDRKQAEAVARMISEGIDPDEIGPPSHFKKKWPSVNQGNLI